MTPNAILHELRSTYRGTFAIDGETFTVSLPAGVSLPEQLQTEIRAAKPALIRIVKLEERLQRGSDMLWEMEQKGEMGSGKYEKTLIFWHKLDADYRTLCDQPVEVAA